VQELVFGSQALWFSVPAIAGTLFFLFRVILLLVGGGVELHHDAGDSSFDLDHGDSSSAFKVLSIQAIAAFLMGFGWAGLFAVRGLGLPVWAGVVVGFGGGAVMMWLLNRVFRLVGRLQSSGTLDISSALEEEGTVYVTVPARRQGRGSVRVVVGDRQQYYSAITDGDALPTGARVRVLEINDDHTLTVEGLPAASLPSGASI
jgi:membrane protein implicated in regulation of membrane protease activity